MKNTNDFEIIECQDKLFPNSTFITLNSFFVLDYQFNLINKIVMQITIMKEWYSVQVIGKDIFPISNFVNSNYKHHLIDNKQSSEDIILQLIASIHALIYNTYILLLNNNELYKFEGYLKCQKIYFYKTEFYKNDKIIGNTIIGIKNIHKLDYIEDVITPFNQKYISDNNLFTTSVVISQLSINDIIYDNIYTNNIIDLIKLDIGLYIVNRILSKQIVFL